jgi:hypothetical protein
MPGWLTPGVAQIVTAPLSWVDMIPWYRIALLFLSTLAKICQAEGEE